MKHEVTAADTALENLLCFAIYATEHSFNQFYRTLLGDLGLTYPQYLVMTLLWDRDDRTVLELGKALDLKSNTLTPLLKRLEASALLSRRRDRIDERQVRVRLTPAGKALKRKAAQVPACVTDALDMSPKELKSAIDTVNKIRKRLKDATTTAENPAGSV
ncbi:MAG: MarR family transcriptional regulator [Pseudomonadota bacterium]